jgi:hypothetical protein
LGKRTYRQDDESNTGYFEQDGIPWSTLSKTFREASILTRELGIGYIWIDSLCIVQDDVEDWAREASHMAEIFLHPYLTIGATGAKNGAGGLLNRNKIHRITKTHEGVDYTVYIRNLVDHELRTQRNKDDPFPSWTELGIRNRAWCKSSLFRVHLEFAINTNCY